MLKSLVVCVKVINNYKTAAEKKGSANEAAGKKKKLSVEAMGDLLESFCSKQKNRKDNKIVRNISTSNAAAND